MFLQMAKSHSFLWLNSIPLCVCVCVCVYIYIEHLLYPFICWWTLRFFPYLGYQKNAAMNMGMKISFIIIIYYFIYLFIYFLSVLCLRCCVQAFSSWGERGLLFFVVHRLLTAVASLCCGAGSLGAWALVVVAHGLSSCGLRALEHRLSSCGTGA